MKNEKKVGHSHLLMRQGETSRGKTKVFANWGNKWDDDRVKLLKKMRLQGSSWYECSVALKTTPMGVFSKAQSMVNQHTKSECAGKCILHAHRQVKDASTEVLNAFVAQNKEQRAAGTSTSRITIEAPVKKHAKKGAK